jgi:hypothetical protein
MEFHQRFECRGVQIIPEKNAGFPAEAGINGVCASVESESRVISIF